MDPMLLEYLTKQFPQIGQQQGQDVALADLRRYMLEKVIPSYQAGNPPPASPMFQAPQGPDIYGPPTPEAPVPQDQNPEPYVQPPAMPAQAGPVAPQGGPSGDVGFMAAQLGQGLAEAGQKMATTPGEILLKYKPKESSDYVKQYLMRKEEERAGRKAKTEEGLAVSREKRAEAEEERAKAQEEFQKELRAEARAKLAIEQQNRAEIEDPNSNTSKGRRVAIEAVYPKIRQLAPDFDTMSAQQLDMSMPASILNAVQDSEAKKMTIEAQKEQRDLLHEEKMAVVESRKTAQEELKAERERKRGQLPEAVAKEFRDVAKVGKRIENIEGLWKDLYKSTGPIEGRVRNVLGRLGVGEATAELQAELGKAFADYVKQISGAAVSEQEFQRLARNMPQLKDDQARFEFLLKSWKREQVNTLSALVESEVNKEPGNERLRENVLSELKAIDPTKTLIEHRGAWRIADDIQDAEVVKQYQATKTINDSMSKAHELGKDLIVTKDDKGQERVQVVLLRDKNREGLKDQEIKSLTFDAIAEAIRRGQQQVLRRGNYIVIDARTFK